MNRRSWIGLSLAVMAAVGGLVPARARAADPIKVSYQPAVYWALPYYVATEKKFWAEAGLEPEFSTFPAGAPQVAAKVPPRRRHGHGIASTAQPSTGNT